MAGLPLGILRKTTLDVIREPGREIPIDGDRIPVPVAHPLMIELIHYLKKKSFRIHIISASNHFSVRLIARELFGLPESCAFGIQPCLKAKKPDTGGEREAVLTARLKKPIPYGIGKARLYKQHISEFPPLITAGDSRSDLHLLRLTHPDGLAIWRGKNRIRYSGTLFPL
jgi:hypothetical protein